MKLKIGCGCVLELNGSTEFTGATKVCPRHQCRGNHAGGQLLDTLRREAKGKDFRDLLGLIKVQKSLPLAVAA